MARVKTHFLVKAQSHMQIFRSYYKNALKIAETFYSNSNPLKMQSGAVKLQEPCKILGINAEKGRWFLVAAGLIIMLCLGAIYAYSIIAVPLKKVFEETPPQGYGLSVSSTEMQIPFIVFLLVFAVTMPLSGKYVEKYGPKKMAMLGAFFVGLGWFLAS